MILKIVRTYDIDGEKQRSETFCEGKEIDAIQNPSGMTFWVSGKPDSISLPGDMENPPPTDVYLMENGRTVERYSFS